VSSKKKENATGTEGTTGRRKNFMKRWIQKIESGSWDKHMEESDNILTRISWGAILLAILYFGGVIFKMWMEGKL
jgi:hypothetical protein